MVEKYLKIGCKVKFKSSDIMKNFFKNSPEELEKFHEVVDINNDKFYIRVDSKGKHLIDFWFSRIEQVKSYSSLE